jgi:hypothetical protein
MQDPHSFPTSETRSHNRKPSNDSGGYRHSKYPRYENKPKHTPTRNLLESTLPQDRERIEELIPAELISSERNNLNVSSHYMYQIVRCWQQHLLQSQEQFTNDITFIIQHQYPSDKRTPLDGTLAAFCFLVPQFAHLIFNPLASLIMRGAIPFRRGAAPFYALGHLISNASQPHKTQKTKANSNSKGNLLGWLESPVSPLVSSQSILELLWMISRVNLEFWLNTKRKTIQQIEYQDLSQLPLSGWVVECLIQTPPSLREAFFSQLLSKHIQVCADAVKQELRISSSGPTHSTASFHKNPFLMQILAVFQISKNYQMATLADSFVPVLLRESEKLIHHHRFEIKEAWMKLQLVKHFEDILLCYFSQSSTLFTHKLLLYLFTNQEPARVPPLSQPSLSQIHPAALETHLQIFPHLIQKIINPAAGNDLFHQPLINYVFITLHDRLPGPQSWFILHFLPIILQGVSTDSQIAKQLFIMIMEKPEYSKLLFEFYGPQERRNRSRSNSNSFHHHTSRNDHLDGQNPNEPTKTYLGLEKLFEILLSQYSSGFYEQIKILWKQAWSNLDARIIRILCRNSSLHTNRSDSPNGSDLARSAGIGESFCHFLAFETIHNYSHRNREFELMNCQWIKIRCLLGIFSRISSEFSDLIEWSFVRFLGGLGHNSDWLSYFCEEISLFFLSEANTALGKLFGVYLEFMQNSLGEERAKIFGETIQRLCEFEVYSSSRYSLISQGYRAQFSGTSTKSGLNFLLSILDPDSTNRFSCSGEVLSYLYVSLIEQCLESLFQVLEHSLDGESKQIVIKILYCLYKSCFSHSENEFQQRVFVERKLASVFASFWVLARVEFLLSIILRTGELSGFDHQAEVVRDGVGLFRGLIKQCLSSSVTLELIRWMGTLIVNPSESAVATWVTELIEYILMTGSQNHLLQNEVLLFIDSHLFSPVNTRNASLNWKPGFKLECIPNPNMIWLLRVLLKHYRSSLSGRDDMIIDDSNHTKFENRLNGTIHLALRGIGSFDDATLLLQLQLLCSAYCFSTGVSEASDQENLRYLRNFLPVVTKVSNQLHFLLNSNSL